jgi:hypothetical protein
MFDVDFPGPNSSFRAIGRAILSVTPPTTVAPIANDLAKVPLAESAQALRCRSSRSASSAHFPQTRWKQHMDESSSRGPDATAVYDVDVLNSLLRGEVAAAESYDLVLARFEGQAPAIALQRIRDEHVEAAAVLRERVRHFGGDPAEGSGIWGKLAAAIAGTAKVLGPASALGALKQGEEFGVGQYEGAFADPDLDADDKDLIRYRPLPRCQSHVRELDRQIARIAAADKERD